ncbi:MAG: SigE family RNA polymerase sigma factor [Actinomycetota bacterium]|nr:SigE family RNA polymerase sigma factor [Actinomycetota bacterium]
MEEELAAFCRREHPRLVGTLTLLVGAPDVAEDLAQEALIRVCRDWGRIGKLEAPGAYTHRLAMNLATSMFRRRAVERRAAVRLRPSSGGEPDPADAVAVRQALLQLRADQRKTIVARFFLGYSVPETARLLGVPEGTVKTHTHRGLAALRDLLGTELTVEEAVSGA